MKKTSGNLYTVKPFHIIWRNFLAGTFHGLGFVLGSAILVGLLAGLFNWILGGLPL